MDATNQAEVEYLVHPNLQQTVDATDPLLILALNRQPIRGDFKFF
jgi:hypothetical protein